MNKMWAHIQDIEVDAREHKDEVADPRKLSAKDVSLAVKTAKDLTVNDDGLFDRKRDSKLEIAVVDPLDVPRPEGAPLDARPSGVVFDLAEVMRALPDIPVTAEVSAPKVPVAVTREAVRASASVAAPEVAAHAADIHRIQVGSFSSLIAAEAAWKDLRDKHSVAAGLKPSYEKVVTPSGKSLVRLKVGPVKSEAQARGLCDAFDVRDSWCARAG